MSHEPQQTDRREFIKIAGAVSAMSLLNVPKVFGQAGSNHSLQLALIGAGGRGTGAVADAIAASSYPIKLVAMADLFPHRLDESHAALSQQFHDRPNVIAVPPGPQVFRLRCLQKGDGRT